MMAYEWDAAARQLRTAGLDALADFYAANAQRVGRGEPAIWPIPAELLASHRLAGGESTPATFADDSREPEGRP